MTCHLLKLELGNRIPTQSMSSIPLIEIVIFMSKLSECFCSSFSTLQSSGGSFKHVLSATALCVRKVCVMQQHIVSVILNATQVVARDVAHVAWFWATNLLPYCQEQRPQLVCFEHLTNGLNIRNLSSVGPQLYSQNLTNCWTLVSFFSLFGKFHVWLLNFWVATRKGHPTKVTNVAFSKKSYK